MYDIFTSSLAMEKHSEKMLPRCQPNGAIVPFLALQFSLAWTGGLAGDDASLLPSEECDAGSLAKLPYLMIWWVWWQNVRSGDM